MRDLTKAFSMIRQFEGCVLKAYPDPISGNQPWTIGYGTTVVNGKSVMSGMVCLQAQAEAWMEADAAIRAAKIDSWLTKPVNDNQMCAMVSLAYNIGLGGLYHSQLLSNLNAGMGIKLCAEDFMHFIHAGGRIVTALIGRRKAEMALFLS